MPLFDNDSMILFSIEFLLDNILLQVAGDNCQDPKHALSWCCSNLIQILILNCRSHRTELNVHFLTSSIAYTIFLVLISKITVLFGQLDYI